MEYRGAEDTHACTNEKKKKKTSNHQWNKKREGENHEQKMKQIEE